MRRPSGSLRAEICHGFAALDNSLRCWLTLLWQDLWLLEGAGNKKLNSTGLEFNRGLTCFYIWFGNWSRLSEIWNDLPQTTFTAYNKYFTRKFNHKIYAFSVQRLYWKVNKCVCKCVLAVLFWCTWYCRLNFPSFDLVVSRGAHCQQMFQLLDTTFSLQFCKSNCLLDVYMQHIVCILSPSAAVLALT